MYSGSQGHAFQRLDDPDAPVHAAIRIVLRIDSDVIGTCIVKDNTSNSRIIRARDDLAGVRRCNLNDEVVKVDIRIGSILGNNTIVGNHGTCLQSGWNERTEISCGFSLLPVYLNRLRHASGLFIPAFLAGHGIETVGLSCHLIAVSVSRLIFIFDIPAVLTDQSCLTLLRAGGRGELFALIIVTVVADTEEIDSVGHRG